MVPAPVAVGLILCEQVIVDQRSGNPTPVNILSALAVDDFPSSEQRFSAFASLTDARGTGTIQLVGTRLDTDEEVYGQEHRIDFPGRHVVVNVHLRLRNVHFPVEGLYEFRLRVDGEFVAQRRLRVHGLNEPE